MNRSQSSRMLAGSRGSWWEKQCDGSPKVSQRTPIMRGVSAINQSTIPIGFNDHLAWPPRDITSGGVHPDVRRIDPPQPVAAVPRVGLVVHWVGE